MTSPSGWKRPDGSFHAHFDCFSGAAGDMMLAACLDTAGEDRNNLLQHVQTCLEEGMPELKGEFSLECKRVWRGMGSIAALHVNVVSKYHHETAPVPAKAQESKEMSHEHSHHSDNSHSHSHEHDHHHSHGHSHTHSNSDLPETAAGVKNNDNHPSLDSSQHNHNHSHSHAHDGSHNHTHSHQEASNNAKGPLRNLPQIRKMLQDAPASFIPEWVRDNAIEAFTELAKAEAMTHGAESMDVVHFHEVGAVDSIVDTVGTLIALHALGVTTVSCSRLPLGEGMVWTDHGLLPVPAPATLHLMVGMPTCPGPKGITGELVTPTAAALLRVLVNITNESSSLAKVQTSGRPPPFTLRKIGIGAGTKDFVQHPNVIRLMLGDSIVEK